MAQGYDLESFARLLCVACGALFWWGANARQFVNFLQASFTSSCTIVTRRIRTLSFKTFEQEERHYMSAPTAAAKNTIRYVAKANAASEASKHKSFNGFKPTIFTYTFQENPKPLNICNFHHTHLIANDPSHPFHIRTQRRLDAFDPTIFHWTVKGPTDLSRKVVVRNWAVRRVKEALRRELKKRGWGTDGSWLRAEKGEKDGLRGALGIYLRKEGKAITASGDEVREECAWLVRRVEELQKAEKWSRLDRNEIMPA